MNRPKVRKVLECASPLAPLTTPLRDKRARQRNPCLALAGGAAFAVVLALASFGCKRAETIDASQYSAADWEARLENPSLNEQEFTKLYAQALAAELKNSKVQITGERHLSVTLADGGSVQVFLDNAWAEASKDPAHRPEICRRYMAGLLATSTVTGEAPKLPDTNSIVAVVRDRLFLQQFSRYNGTTNALVSEPLVADLHIVFACDTSQGISYLLEHQRQALGLSAAALRPLAMDNFHRIMPQIEIVGTGPLFMLKADGNYESSLLLADKLWTDTASSVQGELVAAVPARDVLLFTGASSAEGVKQLREAVDRIHSGGPHVISKTLLVPRNGKWEQWK
jgi:uncharacterized protein YtpQ (UPF0354 family)